MLRIATILLVGLAVLAPQAVAQQRTKKQPATTVAKRSTAKAKAEEVKTGIDLGNFEKTQAWAEQVAASIGRLQAETGNQLVVDKQRNEIAESAKPLIGRSIRWQMPVRAVEEKHVHVLGMFDGLKMMQLVDYGARYQEGDVMLTIGDGISLDAATKLRKGDLVTVVAQIRDVSVI